MELNNATPTRRPGIAQGYFYFGKNARFPKIDSFLFFYRVYIGQKLYTTETIVLKRFVIVTKLIRAGSLHRYSIIILV